MFCLSALWLHAEFVKILILMLHQSECAVACGLILVTVEDWDLNKKSPNHLFVFWKKRFLYWQTDNYCACHFLTLSPMTLLYWAACIWAAGGKPQHNLFTNDGRSFRLNASMAYSYETLAKVSKKQQQVVISSMSSGALEKGLFTHN